MNMRPKMKMFDFIDKKDNEGYKEDEKKEDEDDKDEQLIKDAEEHNEALFPTSW